MSLTKKQKQQTAAACAAALHLWLLLRDAKANTPPKGIVTVGPVTTQLSQATAEDDLRDDRAAIATRILDFIAWNEDENVPTRKPSDVESRSIDTLLSEMRALGQKIPDPDGFDAERLIDMERLVQAARALDPSTTSHPPRAFGSSRFISRRIEIERIIRDAVAMDRSRTVRRRPSNDELTVLRGLELEYAQLGELLLGIDESFEEELAAGEPIEENLNAALALDPRTTATVAARSDFEPGIALA
jgi:hypothetical protein